MHDSHETNQDYRAEMTVPDEYVFEIKQFTMRELGGNNPQYVNIIPSPDARIQDCGNNVEEAVQRLGGRTVKGWRIWWIPGVLFEAQAHVIWERPDGELQDVTPTLDGEVQSLFVEDDSISELPGRDSIPSKYFNIVGHPVVDDFIAAAQEHSRLLDRGKVAELILPCEEVTARKRELLVDIQENVRNGVIIPRRGESIREQAIALQKEREETARGDE